MATHEERVITTLREAFPQGLTSKQVMAIIRFSKLVRYRCRSNAALHSAVKRIFSWLGAKFKTVKMINYKGEEFEALQCELPQLIGGQKAANEFTTEEYDGD